MDMNTSSSQEIPLRTSALLMQHKPVGHNPGEAYFISLDDRNTPSPIRPYNSQQIRILQSCNGLLLCSNNSSEGNCCVYNLSTNHIATVPKHPLGYGPLGYRRLGFGSDNNYFGLIYDPLKSLHYKIIAFVIRSGSSSVDDLHIYSSETGTWKAVVQSFIRAPKKIFPDGVYCNGCIHWLSIYDCFYFNADKEKLETFPRPPIAARSGGRTLYFGESQNHLHVVDILLFSLNVYEMKSDYSEWFIKYQIDLDSISKVFPEMTDGKNYYAVAVLSLIRREKFEEDSFLEESFLVLEIPGKAIRCNLVDRSLKLIWDFGVTFNLKKIEYWTWIPGRYFGVYSISLQRLVDCGWDRFFDVFGQVLEGNDVKKAR
ncbi:putative F-box domain-containing protein [Heracleum sosnowskyi]|uniref:F-box domain-containing protein n=1 Tax=Heracleum sosnowskyi TaxID=360622 RepID=A0AAD8M5M7_9APIA|nr:putative F-box domain-containing protein [Heracleum sosnowskyi]